jgi:uncharacterized protein (DUF488 family)
MRLVTIGGYGFDERRFIEALRAAGVDTFVDVRQRRGLRGRRYAFLNSKRLQAALADAGIRYVHLRDLAPTQAVREVQKKHDTETGTEKRARTRLSPEFIEAYKSEVLDGFDIETFRSRVGNNAKVVALFCVEGQPEACHRSLIAERLGRDLGFEVEHIRP